MRTCNPSFQSNYATIDGRRQVSVDDYITENLSSSKPKCIPNDHELVLVNCTRRRSHFRHKNHSDVEGFPMTEWHAEWQSNFPVTEVPFKNQYGQLKERRADVLISDFKRIVELQHSPMDSSEANNRNKDYALHGHSVIWVIDGQDCIKVKKIGERHILHFEINLWLYETYVDCGTVYYDIEGLIYKVNPSLVRSNQIDVCEPKLKSDFIQSLKTKENLWEAEETPQSYLYVKQKGAGSGKTYGMMQLLNTDPEITNFQWIIFITKQHAAVNVMYSEFMDQYKKGKLNNIELQGDPLIENKKYIVKYKHKLTNVETCAVFATVDSFTYAVGTPSKTASNTFEGIVKSIKEGVSKVKRSGALKFAGVDPFINKETIVMIDETQDLSELYGEAFLKFVSTTHTNLCVVGDRLQSLSYKENALTFLHRADAAGMKVVREEASNIVRRFANPKLINFVNSVIPFEKYDLPSMTSEVTEEEDEKSLTIFSSKTIYANQSADEEPVIDAVSQIMNYYKLEVETEHRVPEDFLIVTPFTGKNPLVEALQLAINVFWKDMMENEQYIEKVKNINEYWKDINPNDYTRYAVFHKSEEMGSINLADSEHATRMVSIHSSKGDGRKVVFVIGVTQSSLQLFSQVANNLIYNSLFHVAITRQKERLYFRLEANKDDIHKRISKSNSQIVVASNTEFDFSKDTIKLKHIADDILKFSFDELTEAIVSKNPPPKLPSESEEKLLIDMGDHNIRFASMIINVLVHICNHEQQTKSDTKRQIHAILSNLNSDMIKIVPTWRDYVNTLQINNNNNNPGSKDKRLYIPVLRFDTRGNDKDYERYFKIIIDTVFRILDELKSLGRNQLHYFCPLECVVLYYMLECTRSGKFQKITINDVYNIVDVYSKVYDDKATGHESCNCNKYFQTSTHTLTEKQVKQQLYLRNHYDRLTHVRSILDEFVADHPSVSWLFNHGIKFNNDSEDKNEDFNIHTGLPLVGYDKETVYVFILKPQLGEINLNDIVTQSIMETWILLNSSTDNNKARFSGKPIKVCTLSLNRTELYMMDWTKSVEDSRTELTNILYNTIYNKFQSKHEQYYNTFEHVLKEVDGPKKIAEHCLSQWAKSLPPAATYIEKFWLLLQAQIEDADGKEERKEILDKYADKATFIKKLDKLLDKSLMGHLGMVEEDD